MLQRWLVWGFSCVHLDSNWQTWANARYGSAPASWRNWVFFCDEEGFLQSSKEGLLAEAEVSELPRRPAMPLTCWEEMDVSTAEKEVRDLLVA